MSNIKSFLATTPIVDGHILPVLLRYIDHYHWSWSFSTKIINLYHGTAYTGKELRALYQANK